MNVSRVSIAIHLIQLKLQKNKTGIGLKEFPKEKKPYK